MSQEHDALGTSCVLKIIIIIIMMALYLWDAGYNE
jgi:hypothetical protein